MGPPENSGQKRKMHETKKSSTGMQRAWGKRISFIRNQKQYRAQVSNVDERVLQWMAWKATLGDLKKRAPAWGKINRGNGGFDLSPILRFILKGTFGLGQVQALKKKSGVILCLVGCTARNWVVSSQLSPLKSITLLFCVLFGPFSIFVRT